MRYTPINKTASEILLSLGFKPANRGYILKYRQHRRVHALIEVNEINLHIDHIGGGKPHRSHPFCAKAEEWIEKIKLADNVSS